MHVFMSCTCFCTFKVYVDVTQTRLFMTKKDLSQFHFEFFHLYKDKSTHTGVSPKLRWENQTNLDTSYIKKQSFSNTTYEIPSENYLKI